MRRFLITMIAATALATAGCGDDEAADNTQQTRDRVAQAPEPRDATELAAETQRLAEQIARAARDLADDPEVDADQRLEDAERRANELAEQAQGDDADASAALRQANQRLASAAAELRAAESTEDVGRVLDEQLGQITDALDGDAGRRVQDELDRLREDLPELGR